MRALILVAALAACGDVGQRPDAGAPGSDGRLPDGAVLPPDGAVGDGTPGAACLTHHDCHDALCLEPTHVCAEPADIAYAVPTGHPGPCTQERPCATLFQAEQTGRRYVRLGQGAFSGSLLVRRSLGIYGEHTQLDGVSDGSSHVTLDVGGGDIELVSLTIGPSGDRGLALRAVQGNVLARDLAIHGPGTCVQLESGKLNMERSYLGLCDTSLRINGGSYSVRNNVIRNAEGNLGDNVTLTADPDSRFDFNTLVGIASNLSRLTILCTGFATVENNVIVHAALDSKCRYSSNLIHDHAVLGPTDYRLPASNILADPLLVDEPAGALALKPESIGAGAAVNITRAPRDDFYGFPRDAPMSIGAFEVTPLGAAR